MSQHSHPRSQRNSAAKSPSRQEEEENALEECSPESTLDELQRELEEELRSSDQVLSRIRSKYSKTGTPTATERSYHASLVDNAQLDNYQGPIRTPISNRSRRNSPVPSTGIPLTAPEELNENLLADETTYMDPPPLIENCEADDVYIPEKEPLYEPVANEAPADADVQDLYSHRGTPTADPSTFRSSLDRIQSMPSHSGHESQHRNLSGQNVMLENQDMRGPSATMSSITRNSPAIGSASRGLGGVSSTATNSAIRTPSKRMSCRESNCERFSQGVESMARSTLRSGRIDSKGQYMQSQCSTEANNYNGSTKYMEYPEEMPVKVMSSGAGEVDQTFIRSRSGLLEAVSSTYQKPPSLEAAFGQQPYQRSQNPVQEAGSGPCSRTSNPRAGAESRSCNTTSGSRAESRGQPCQTLQNSRTVAFDDCYSRASGLQVGNVDKAFPRNQSPTPEPLSSSYQRQRNLEAGYGNRCPPSGLRADAGPHQYQRTPTAEAEGQFCQPLETPRAMPMSQGYQTAPNQNRPGGGISLFQKTPGFGTGVDGQICQTSPRSQPDNWDNVNYQTQRFEGKKGNQYYQENLSSILEVGGPLEKTYRVESPLDNQFCERPGSSRMEAGVQQYQRPTSPPAQGAGMPCHLQEAGRARAGGQQYQRAQSPIAQAQAVSCQQPASARGASGGQHYQRATSPVGQPCQSPAAPRTIVDQPYERTKVQAPGVQSCQSSGGFRAEVETQRYQRQPNPVGQAQAMGQSCSQPGNSRMAPGGQQYQRPLSPVNQPEGHPCPSSGSPRGLTGIQPYQGRNLMAEPWDNFYSHLPCAVPGAESQRPPPHSNSGARGGVQFYQKPPNVSGQSHHKAPNSIAIAGAQSPHGEPNIEFSHMDSAHHDHDHHDHQKRSHVPNEKKSQALYRLSQLKKTPSLSQCKIENDLEFLNVCCPKTNTAEKTVKIPERPCLKRQEIETLVKCESRDVDDTLFVSADVGVTYKKPCPKQQKAQMSVQALVQAHAKQSCQPNYTPLEHPDPEDITPELAATMMFSQEQGLKMEECPYNIVAHLYPDEVPFTRKSRPPKSDVSVVDGQKEQEEIIEKSASVPSEGVSDSVFSRKMKERGEEMEARSSCDMEFAIGQTQRQYVLVTQNPDRINKIQFRGGSSPLWFPGYFSAFPDEPGLNQVPSPSEIFQKAWIHSNPKNMPTNDVIVLD